MCLLFSEIGHSVQILMHLVHKTSIRIIMIMNKIVTNRRTSGVPQKVLVVPMPSMPSLQRPKSVSVMWPWKSSQQSKFRYKILGQYRQLHIKPFQWYLSSTKGNGMKGNCSNLVWKGFSTASAILFVKINP